MLWFTFNLKNLYRASALALALLVSVICAAVCL